MKRFKKIIIAIVFLILLNISIWSSLFQTGNNKFEITFIDVGQGDAILIKTPNNYYGIIDGGPSNNLVSKVEDLLPENKNYIDFILITHPDKDHIKGFEELIKNYNIGTVFINKYNKHSSTLKAIEQMIQEKRIQNYSLNESTDFLVDGVYFDIIWPSQDMSVYDFYDFNETSISAHISYRGFDFITMGDLSSKFEKQAIKNINKNSLKDVELFKASHHGSRFSGDQELFQLISPQYTIFSTGINNTYGHPSLEVIENALKVNSEILRTDIDGNIKFSITSYNDFEIFK